MKAPFPYFGGKSKVAQLVWERFGNVANYVEPFFGSGAVLLSRPHEPKIETVNDADAHLANFWRATQSDPNAVAKWCDWPVNECDLLARHEWLLRRHDELKTAVIADAEYYDVKAAGWWVWGICCWIGSGWCRQRGDGSAPEQIPHLGDAGRGQIPSTNLSGVCGVNVDLIAMFSALSERLRRVRVACGDWARVTGDSVTWRHGLTGVFLDPPYSEGTVEYAAGGGGVSADVAKWAIANGDNPKMRIVLCGYEGEHQMPKSWDCVPWKAHGGYGSQGDGAGRENAHRERIWFSPHCLSQRGQLALAV